MFLRFVDKTWDAIFRFNFQFLIDIVDCALQCDALLVIELLRAEYLARDRTGSVKNEFSFLKSFEYFSIFQILRDLIRDNTLKMTKKIEVKMEQNLKFESWILLFVLCS